MLGAVQEANRANDFFGWSVHVDGDLAVIGAPGDLYANMECYDQATGEFIQGYAYIVKLNADMWDSNDEYLAGEMGAAIGMLEYRGFGRSVSIKDGVVAVSSYPLYNRPELPVIYVYDCSGEYCIDYMTKKAPATVLNAITDVFASTQIGDPDRIAPQWQNTLWGAHTILQDSYLFVSDPSLHGVWQYSIVYDTERKHASTHAKLVDLPGMVATRDMKLQACPQGSVGANACSPCPTVHFSHSVWNEECIRCPPSMTSPGRKKSKYVCVWARKA